MKKPTHGQNGINPPGRLPVANFVLLTGLLFASPGFTEQSSSNALKPFIAKYVAENNYITGGKATLSLTKNKQGSFDFILQTIPTGIFKWTGKGNIREHAELRDLTKPFESISYRYTDKGDSERSYRIDFNRANDEFQISSNGNVATHQLAESTLDRLSVTLAVMSEAQDNRKFAEISVQSLDRTRTQEIIFSNRGPEQVTTGLGNIDALRIHKVRESSNRETIIWLAQLDEKNSFVPVKIEHFKYAKLTLRLVLTSFSAVE